MKAGKYYIGDLCYVMTDTEWDEFCSLTICGKDCLDGIFTFKDGRTFATFGTAYGDGCYPARQSRGTAYRDVGVCPVDAGLIGCFLVEDVKKPEGLEGGVVVDIETDFIPYESEGVIHFASFFVDTCGDADEDDDEDNSDESED